MSGRRRADRKRVLLIVLLGVAVAAIPGRLAWSMRASTVAETDQVREQTRLVREQLDQAKRDQKRAADLKDQLQLLATAMPADPDLPSVVDALAALAAESHVVWKASAQTAPATKETARVGAEPATTTTTVAPDKSSSSTLPTDEPASDGGGSANATSGSYLVEVDVAGTSTALTAYLEGVRSLTRLLTVERLSLTWTDGDTAEASAQVVTAHLTLKAYSWAGAPKPSATTTAAASSS